MAFEWPKLGGGLSGSPGFSSSPGVARTPGMDKIESMMATGTNPYHFGQNPQQVQGGPLGDLYARTQQNYQSGLTGAYGDSWKTGSPQALPGVQVMGPSTAVAPSGDFGMVGYGTGHTGGGGTDMSIYQRPGTPGMGAPGAPAPGVPGAPSVPGSPGPGGNSFTQNPFYSSMADDITRRTNESRDRGLNAIRTNAVGLGGLGGSRQGVAEAGAISGAADSLAGQLSALGGGMWNQDQNRDLQRYQGDQSFYTAQRGQDYQGIGLGADLLSRGLQMPWQPLQNASGIYSPYSGMGQQTSTSQQGGGWGGAIGGALGMGQFAQNMGWWGK